MPRVGTWIEMERMGRGLKLKIAVLSAALSCQIMAAAASDTIPLQWYQFEVTQEQLEASSPKPKAKPKEEIAEKRPERSEKEVGPQVVRKPKDAMQPATSRPDDAYEKKIAEIQKRRAKDERLLQELKEKQKEAQAREQEKAEAEKRAAQQAASSEARKNQNIGNGGNDLLRLLQEMRTEQQSAVQGQSEQMQLLVATIAKQQEELRQQKEQLQELQKYKDTMVIDPTPMPEAELDYPSERSRRQSDALTLQYMPGSLYQVYCRPNFETDLQLRPGEKIVSISAGDQSRWSIRPVEGNLMSHIYIRPIQLGLETNLIIHTDARRTYQVQLRAASQFNPIVRWTYPADEGVMQTNALPVSVESFKELSFRYQVSKQHSWRPKFVFNDGFRTYIHMPIDSLKKAPAILIKNPNGTMTLTNYTIKNGNYVIDKVFDEASLYVGNEHVVIKKV